MHGCRHLFFNCLQVLHRRAQKGLRVDLLQWVGPDAVELQLVALVGLVGRFRGRRGLVLRRLLIVTDQLTDSRRRPLEDGGAFHGDIPPLVKKSHK